MNPFSPAGRDHSGRAAFMLQGGRLMAVASLTARGAPQPHCLPMAPWGVHAGMLDSWSTVQVTLATAQSKSSWCHFRMLLPQAIQKAQMLG